MDIFKMSQYDIFKILVDELNAVNLELSDCQNHYVPNFEYKIRPIKGGGWEVYELFNKKITFSQKELEEIILERRKLFHLYPDCKSKNYRYRTLKKVEPISFKMKVLFYKYKMKQQVINLFLRMKKCRNFLK